MSIKKIMDYLDKSFWFIPGLFAIFPFILFFGLFNFATPGLERSTKYTFLFHIVGDPQTVRIILGAIAGAAISIVSISFSITILVLSIASQQYSPRLLQNFMRKNDTKVILGIFISTFIYCLVTIGVARDGAQYSDLISILALIGLLLGIISLMAFIYFINYVIQAISLTNIISNIEEDIFATINKFYPSLSDNENETTSEVPHDGVSSHLLVLAKETGYLQSVNYSKLSSVAVSHKCCFKTLFLPGSFVIEKTPICEVFHSKEQSPEDVIRSIDSAFFVNYERKVGDDILFPVSQLVDIAVKALSPGINDPKTASNCIDVLAKSIAYLACRSPMPRYLKENNEITVIMPVCTAHDFLKSSFRVIYDHSRKNHTVLCHLLKIISMLLKVPSDEAFKNALVYEANIIRLYNNLDSFDRHQLVEYFDSLQITSMHESEVTG